MAFLSVRYDQLGGFAGGEFHDSVEEALASSLAAGCLFASVGEHPKAERTRHFAYREEGWS